MNVTPQNAFKMTCLAGAVFISTGLLLASAGQLDPTFGIGGKVLTPFPTCPNFCSASANAAALQSDGKIVVGGTIITATGTGSASVLVRYTTKGQLDSTFGTRGMAMLPSTTPGAGFSAVAIQTDGKIVAGSGQLEKGFIVARFNTDGTLDTNFGTAGLTIFGNRLLFPPIPETLLIQTDGKIILSTGSLTRLNTNGSLDTTFGVGGTAAVVGGVAAALQSDGKILVSNGFNVSRYNTDGALDTSFGITGIAGTAVGAGALLEQPNGAIVGAGPFTTQPAPSGSQLTELALTRLTSTGLPDVTFGMGGGAFAPPSNSGLLSSAAAEVLQPNGSIVVGGQTAVVGVGGGSSNPTFEVGRFLSTGQLDTSFGGTGTVITSFGGTTEFVTAVLLQTNGKIIAVGNSLTSVSVNETQASFALARYLGN